MDVRSVMVRVAPAQHATGGSPCCVAPARRHRSALGTANVSVHDNMSPTRHPVHPPPPGGHPDDAQVPDPQPRRRGMELAGYGPMDSGRLSRSR